MVVAESVDNVSNILPNDGVDDIRDCASESCMLPEEDMAMTSGGMSMPPRSASAGLDGAEAEVMRSGCESSSYGDLMDFMSACSEDCCMDVA